MLGQTPSPDAGSQRPLITHGGPPQPPYHPWSSPKPLVILVAPEAPHHPWSPPRPHTIPAGCAAVARAGGTVHGSGRWRRCLRRCQWSLAERCLWRSAWCRTPGHGGMVSRSVRERRQPPPVCTSPSNRLDALTVLLKPKLSVARRGGTVPLEGS